MIQLSLKSGLVANSLKAAAMIDRELPGIMEEIGTTLVMYQRLNFEKKSRGGIGDDGIKWAPLKPSTIEKKSRGGGAGSPSQIGVDTGKMRNSVSPGFRGSSSSTGFSSDSVGILRVREFDVEIGYATDEYVHYFDEGTERMPARPLMPPEGQFPAKWTKRIDQIVFEWLDGITDRASE